MSVIKRSLDRMYAIRIMTILSREFPEWPAFKLGIIDTLGNLVKRPRTSEEKAAYTRLDAVLRPVKIALNKFPGGVSALARAYLVKGFLYETELVIEAVSNSHRAYETSDEEVDAFIIGIVTGALVGLNPNDDSLTSIFEEMVAGDAGGNPEKIAKGETSGAVTFPGPSTFKKKKKVDKKKDD